MPYATGTIAGTFHQLDGSPSEGTAYLSLTGITPAQVKDTVGNVVLSGTRTVRLVDGVATFSSLPATDDATLNPSGFGYQIVVALKGRRDPIRVSTALPGGSTVQIEDLIDAPAATFTPTSKLDGGSL